MRYVALEEAFTIPNLPELSPGDALKTLGISLRPDLAEEFAKKLPDFSQYRIPAMDAAGIDVQVLSLTPPGLQVDIEASSAVDAARRANDYLAEVIAQHPSRFAGFAALPLQDPDAAVAELTRGVEELGLRGALVNDYLGGEYLDQPRYDELWAALASLGVPLYLHPGVPPVDTWSMLDGQPWLYGAMWSWQATTGGHAMRLVCGGVFDRHPEATLILGHMGEFLPFQLTRFDARWASLDVQQHLEQAPSQYFGRNIVITTTGVFSPPVLRAAVEVLGADAVLFSSDYPYESLEDSVALIEKTELVETDRSKIAHRNADRLLRLTTPQT